MKKSILKKTLVAGSILALWLAVMGKASATPETAQVQLTINPWTVTIWIDSGVLTNLDLNLGSIMVSNNSQTVTGEFGNDAFWLDDQKWAEAGYYTTIQVSDLSWSNNHVISASNVKLKSTSLNVISWEQGTANIGLSNSAFTTANTALTYFQRTTTNVDAAWRLGKFGDNLQIEVTVPAHTVADTYRGTITYTLFDGEQPGA